MYKQVTTALLLLCFMAQALCQPAIVGSYYVNTAAYAKDCINKTRPQMHCNGRCQMMKKLNREEKKDAQNPERRSSGKNEVLSSKSHFASLQLITTGFMQDHFDHAASLTTGRPRAVFHPPGA